MFRINHFYRCHIVRIRIGVIVVQPAQPGRNQHSSA